MVLDRKGFKSPPAALTSTAHSQAARRAQALEEQRRRREQRYDSSRSLDILSSLNLGLSDDDQDDEDGTNIVQEGIAQFASMLPAYTSTEPLPPPGKKRGRKRRNKKKQTMAVDEASDKTQSKKRKSQWADKCMYAELLEMKPEAVWDNVDDGLPEDLEFGWIAVGPVPVGKRCLAVTYHSSGVAGSVPNTTLRSRLVGKHLMPPFPSILPPNTVLDCILDEKWESNGILHILDVLKWKGQDIADCETAFRFWWRDTRMSELIPPTEGSTSQTNMELKFPHPTSFIPIPYHSDLSLPNLLQSIIPSTRSARLVTITIDPTLTSNESSMLTDVNYRVSVEIQSEGMLLYVSQATYEPGQNPLSSWIPVTYENVNHLELFERLVSKRLERGPSREVEMDV